MIYVTDIIYKIASVIYFTKDEDYMDYDDLLGREKVALFKAQDKGDKKMSFFFRDALSEYHRFSEYLRQRFANLYDGGESDNSGAFENHFYHIIQQKRDDRMISNMELANQNNMTYDDLKHFSWYDHHVLLEKTRAASRQNTPQDDEFWQ